jgi:flavin-dependent dehydrogenase
MFDIAIVGSGPAGSALARLIGNNFKILLIDKRNLEKPFEDNFVSKPCGGLISPDAQKMMVSLALLLPQEIIVRTTNFSLLEH